MTVLVDTQIWVWSYADAARVSTRAVEALSTHRTLYSAVSAWETSIKRALGKLDVPHDFSAIVAGRGGIELAVSVAHADAAGALPRHHADPFDRLLVAQAQIEGVPIVTSDSRFSAYDVEVIW